MKRILCTSIALIMLLTACSAPVQIPPPTAEMGGDHTYGVYAFTFSVQHRSGQTFEKWDLVYACNGQEIQNGHQFLFSLGLFAFYSISVDVIERDHPRNSYRATFPVPIYDGGSGETEITVTDRTGNTATFKVTCNVTQVGQR